MFGDIGTNKSTGDRNKDKIFIWSNQNGQG